MNALRPLRRAPLALALGVLIAISACADVPGRGHIAKLRGIRIYYEVHGHGTPLFLLHGGAGNGKQFSNQVPEFSKHYRCIVPDACAQGRTSDRAEPLTYHAMAEDVVALMDRLHIRRADVMGWSDGGDVGLDIAMHHPERVNHFVTFGANFRADGLNPADVEWNSTANAESFGPGARADYERMTPDKGHFEVAMSKIIAMWRTEPNWTLEQLHTIRAKTLICAGDHDLIRPDHTEALAGAIPGARKWIVPDASHGAILEKPELVNRTVLAFLADRPLPPS